MNSPVLLFDGVCNLCNWMVKFILKHEKDNTILFAPLQSEAGKRILNQFNMSSIDKGMDTVVFISKTGKAFVQSSASYQIAKHLKKPYSYFYILNILPEKFNNFFYRMISKYRYKIFGKQNECMIADESLKSRFLK